MAVTIIKADGTAEEFDPKKIARSLMRAGAAEEMAQNITADIELEVHSGMTTHDIYRRAFELLRGAGHAAARYSLKRSLFDLGPSGFPFEQYLAELFRIQGYEAVTDQHIRGRCVEHEVDLVLEHAGERTYVEAKFHNTPGFKTDLQVTLYVQARMEDLRAAGAHLSDPVMAKARGLLATNTKFTSQAMQYAQCAGLDLLGWEYPERGNLHDLIETGRLYPVTALLSLSHAQKSLLIAAGIMLCRDLLADGPKLQHVGLPAPVLARAAAEAAELCATAQGI